LLASPQQLKNETKKRFADSQQTALNERVVNLVKYYTLVLEKDEDNALIYPLNYGEKGVWLVAYGAAYDIKDILRVHSVGATTLNGVKIPFVNGAPEAKFINRDTMARLKAYDLPLAKHLPSLTEVSATST
jgi:hypothetical protein